MVLERADRIGKKILISGGGRCNFTNLHSRAENFISSNPHFVKSPLARYTPRDFIDLVEKHRIPYHEKTLGQLFCDGSAREIVEMLAEECRAARVKIVISVDVQKIEPGFAISTSEGRFEAGSLVVSTGGLSIPKMGTTGFGYDIARQFGLRIRDCRPALVPLTFSADDRARYSDLAGVSTEVVASCGSQKFREKMLFTHRGLSGPAILQISSYWRKPQSIALDLAPGKMLLEQLARRDLQSLRTALRTSLPNRLADRWAEVHAPERWTDNALAELERLGHRWEVAPAGDEGYDKAEVTAGGVDTDELSAKTLESRKVPGLYFVGEVVDVTGHLGGFNFQWAWASGYCAGQVV